jgi:hypothetical protein
MINLKQEAKLAMQKFEVILIEPSDLAHYWVVSYRIGDGEIEKEAIEALDSNEAFIKFRNQFINQFKVPSKSKRPKKKSNI